MNAILLLIQSSIDNKFEGASSALSASDSAASAFVFDFTP
jgi:hypothetical protein